jgi:uracil-DNA glycosylase family 4
MPRNANKVKIMNNYEALVWLAEIGADEAIEAEPVTNRRGTGDNQWSVAGLPSEALAKEGGQWPVASLPSEASAKAGGQPEVPPLTPPQAGGITSRARGSSDHPIIRSSIIESALAEAQTLAEAATTLPELYEAIRRFRGCELRKTAANTVIGDGNPASGLMFIGEAPGAEEDKAGIPFCGASGQLLTTMLGFIGLTRASDYYITNVCFWRPPGNRPPTEAEIALCRPLVERHIALVNPKRLVLLGGVATQALLKNPLGITKLRGQVFTYKNDFMAGAIPAHALYHPSYLLRQPSAKKQVWGDLLALKGAILST